ncbi:amino acid permease [Oesophagostomum dentatum]|uniref:Amino acid permease n=1 Tax=Oesophagostomum dentatum TaxID=61180 RepID=A0A0B1SYH5_OESDE|nr:amino acid permease [Oesophagostomum dentatum]
MVHFSVGDKDQEDDRKREQAETNTTINLKSWRNMKTIEHPPIMDFYPSRPSMLQLIHGDKAIPEEIEIEGFKKQNDELVEGQIPHKPSKVEKFSPPPTQARVKFGWIEGVFVRCLLNIFGVMLYLRISWVAGQAGIGLGSVIVLLASTVTTITAISTCAICTNGDVKGGGAYFLISRSLGPEFGGSIGIIFSIANAVGGAMYIVGFAETVRDIMREASTRIMDGELWDVRIVGFATCIVLMGIIFIGTQFESKMQIFLLVILVASIVDYMVGSVFPATDAMLLRGGTGYSVTTMFENLLPSFRDEDFFSVFAVYFPAATGIMAGANISGDLADPQHAIPLGTLLAIAVTTVIYLATVWMTGSTCRCRRYFPPVWNGSKFIPPDCAANFTCPYGLMNYFQIMEMESFWGPLITAGIFAATLSSALASLVSAPKVFQAVCKDRLFPKIGYFAKPYGKNEEPRRAYALTFIIAMGVIAIGDLNTIAPIISNFFLCSYALINYACFDASFADSPGFRPGFKYYNMWVSLGGALLCIIVMFIISWATALITFFCFAGLFLYILHRKPDVNWGSSTQAHSYKNALSGMIKLANTEEHVKNYRPQLLVLCGNAAARPSLIDFAYSITKGTSLMMCGYVVPVCGLGKLRPNIILIGFKTDWYRRGPIPEAMEEMNEYFGTIQLRIVEVSRTKTLTSIGFKGVLATRCKVQVADIRTNAGTPQFCRMSLQREDSPSHLTANTTGTPKENKDDQKNEGEEGKGDTGLYSVMRKLERQLSEWLRKRHVKAFYVAVANASLRVGAQSLIQVCGLGKLRPNIILIGFKTDWYRRGPIPEAMEEMNEYFGTIQDAFDSNMAVCVLRNGDMGLDFSEAMKLLNVGEGKRLDINLEDTTVEKKK